MNEYIISLVSSSLPKNKRNEELYRAFKKYETFLLTEEGERDFHILLEAQVTEINDNSPRAKPLSVRRSDYGESIWYTIKASGGENGMTISLRKVQGRFETEKDLGDIPGFEGTKEALNDLTNL